MRLIQQLLANKM